MNLLIFLCVLQCVSAYTKHEDDEKNLSFVSGLLIGILLRHYLYIPKEQKTVPTLTEAHRESLTREVIISETIPKRSRSRRKSARLKTIGTLLTVKKLQDSKSTV